MGLSDFQTKKLLHVFSKFYDTNGDQVIDWKDFALDLEKLSAALNWAEGSAQRQKAESALKSIWDGLRASADKNHDDEISKDEWLKMWDECIANKGKGAGLPGWVNEYMNFMFSANDGNGDDVIDVDEYTALFTKYGLSEAECKAAFTVITDNDKVKLTLGEYEKLWCDFFFSADCNARGNSVFGKI